MKNLYCILFMLCFTVTNFSCSDDSDNNEQVNVEMDFQLQLDIADDKINLYEDLLTDNTPEQSRVLLVENLLEETDIINAGISEDGTTVCWEYKDGLEYCYLTETSLTLLSQLDRSSNPLNRTDESLLNEPIISDNNNALVLSPYYYEFDIFDSLDESNELAEMLGSSGFNVTYKFNDSPFSLNNISLQDYKDFNNYGVIAISTHGGVGGSTGNVFINSGVKFTEDLKTTLQDDIQNKRVGIGSARIPYDLLAVSPLALLWTRVDMVNLSSSWFDHEYQTKLDNTLVYSGSCKGLANEGLANALIGNESAFVGWTDNVSIFTGPTNGINFFDYLLEGQTIGEAYGQVVQDGTTTSGDAVFKRSNNTNNNLTLVPNVDPCQNAEIFKDFYLNCTDGGSSSIVWTITLDYYGTGPEIENPGLILERTAMGGSSWQSVFPDGSITWSVVDSAPEGGTVEIVFDVHVGSNTHCTQVEGTCLRLLQNWDFRVALTTCGVQSDFVIFNLEYYGSGEC